MKTLKEKITEIYLELTETTRCINAGVFFPRHILTAKAIELATGILRETILVEGDDNGQEPERDQQSDTQA